MSDETQTTDGFGKQLQTPKVAPIDLDYGAPAELFPCRTKSGRSRIKYKRFETAAEAIRFAVEDTPSAALLGAYIEVDEARFGRNEIQCLYEDAAYPLKRRAAVRAPMEI